MKKLPDVATFQEQGLTSKALQLVGWVGLIGPAGLPAEIVERLSSLMVEAGRTARIRELLDTFGIDEAATDHKTFAAVLKEQNQIWIDVVKQLGLTPQ